ncbi:MAG: ribbon-helix-helix protein, CopG family [Myxococcales bacterium]|nr:ribbon-helix-helix protein, CopG family [Myxococcales bacterium]
MNFNLYVDAATGACLDRLARRRRTTRNALIREAVSRLLDGTGDACWPREVVLFEGVPRAPRFEAERRKLRAPRKDPLA